MSTQCAFHDMTSHFFPSKCVMPSRCPGGGGGSDTFSLFTIWHLPFPATNTFKYTPIYLLSFDLKCEILLSSCLKNRGNVSGHFSTSAGHVMDFSTDLVRCLLNLSKIFIKAFVYADIILVNLLKCSPKINLFNRNNELFLLLKQ